MGTDVLSEVPLDDYLRDPHYFEVLVLMSSTLNENCLPTTHVPPGRTSSPQTAGSVCSKDLPERVQIKFDFAKVANEILSNFRATPAHGPRPYGLRSGHRYGRRYGQGQGRGQGLGLGLGRTGSLSATTHTRALHTHMDTRRATSHKWHIILIRSQTMYR